MGSETASSTHLTLKLDSEKVISVLPLIQVPSNGVWGLVAVVVVAVVVVVVVAVVVVVVEASIVVAMVTSTVACVSLSHAAQLVGTNSVIVATIKIAIA